MKSALCADEMFINKREEKNPFSGWRTDFYHSYPLYADISYLRSKYFIAERFHLPHSGRFHRVADTPAATLKGAFVH